MNAKVVRLTRYLKKGESDEELHEARLVFGLGIDGDIHQGGERQISLFSAEARRWMEVQTVQGLCFARFKENILTEGVPLENLAEGTLLSIGDAVLKISTHGKHCFCECGLFSLGTNCRLSGCAVFAVVEQSGIVRSGDCIKVLRFML